MENEEGLKTSDKPWLFKKGCMPGPGRPKGVGKSLKEYAREYLANMTEEERLDYLDGMDKKTIWEMSEGKPQTDLTSGGKPIESNTIMFSNFKDEE